jgi:hypothetical protein
MYYIHMATETPARRQMAQTDNAIHFALGDCFEDTGTHRLSPCLVVYAWAFFCGVLR